MRSTFLSILFSFVLIPSVVIGATTGDAAHAIAKEWLKGQLGRTNEPFSIISDNYYFYRIDNEVEDVLLPAPRIPNTPTLESRFGIELKRSIEELAEMYGCGTSHEYFDSLMQTLPAKYRKDVASYIDFTVKSKRYECYTKSWIYVVLPRDTNLVWQSLFLTYKVFDPDFMKVSGVLCSSPLVCRNVQEGHIRAVFTPQELGAKKMKHDTTRSCLAFLQQIVHDNIITQLRSQYIALWLKTRVLQQYNDEEYYYDEYAPIDTLYRGSFIRYANDKCTLTLLPDTLSRLIYSYIVPRPRFPDSLRYISADTIRVINDIVEEKCSCGSISRLESDPDVARYVKGKLIPVALFFIGYKGWLCQCRAMAILTKKNISGNDADVIALCTATSPISHSSDFYKNLQRIWTQQELDTISQTQKNLRGILHDILIKDSKGEEYLPLTDK